MGKTRNENYFKNRIFLKLLPIQKIKQHDSFEIFTLIFMSSLIVYLKMLLIMIMNEMEISFFEQ